MAKKGGLGRGLDILFQDTGAGGGDEGVKMCIRDRSPIVKSLRAIRLLWSCRKSWVWNFQMGLCIGCSKIFELPEDMFYLENHSHLCYN